VGQIRVAKSQEFVISGFKPNVSNFDSILVGYFEKRRLNFAGRVRAGLTLRLREAASLALRGITGHRADRTICTSGLTPLIQATRRFESE
jgi:hypothetical protein